MLDARGSKRRSFRESSNQFVEELFCADLELERIAAVFDANIK
jgi:hypothetical protein